MQYTHVQLGRGVQYILVQLGPGGTLRTVHTCIVSSGAYTSCSIHMYNYVQGVHFIHTVPCPCPCYDVLYFTVIN